MSNLDTTKNIVKLLVGSALVMVGVNQTLDNKNHELAKTLGRALLASVFIVPAIQSIMNFNQFAGSIQSKNIPLPQLVAAIVLALKLLGGLSIVFNKHDGNTVKALITFTILATVLYHNAFADPTQLHHMMKNISIIGGLVLLYFADSCSIRAAVFTFKR